MAYKIAGIDVHKKMLAVVVADVEVEGDFHFERHKVGTSPDELRALAGWGDRRVAALPDVPTFKELGYPDAEFYIWAGLFAPAGLQPDVAARIRASVRDAVQDPDFRSAMTNVNTPISFLEGAEFDRFLDTDTKRLAAVVQRMGKTE